MSNAVCCEDLLGQRQRGNLFGYRAELSSSARTRSERLEGTDFQTAVRRNSAFRWKNFTCREIPF